MKGSTVYLTKEEKEALMRAIDQYGNDALYATDKGLIDFYIETDEKPLGSVSAKLRGQGGR